MLDCPLEYKKGESHLAMEFMYVYVYLSSFCSQSIRLDTASAKGQTNVEITKEADWEKLLQQEEAGSLAVIRTCC